MPAACGASHTPARARRRAGLVSVMLCIGGRTPYKTLLARASGRVWQADFSPQYSDRGALDRVESVPFRLTRNLHTFFTPFGVEGLFVSALAAGAEARPAAPRQAAVAA